MKTIILAVLCIAAIMASGCATSHAPASAWEYKSTTTYPEAVGETVTREAKEGWSFVSMAAASKLPENVVVVVLFKKPIARVALFADGRLTVDGRPSDVKGLRACLKPVKRQHGSVWYFRQRGGPPPAIAMEVMRTLIDTQLPIRYSSHADFSDSTDEDGRPIVN